VKPTGIVPNLLAVVALVGCSPWRSDRAEDWPWGEPVHGLESRLVFEKRVYREGEQIVCSVEVRNVGDKTVTYDDRTRAFVQILGPDRQETQDTHGVQRGGSSYMSRLCYVDENGRRLVPPPYKYPLLKSGEVFRVEAYRVDGFRYLNKAGRYVFRWPGAKPVPPVDLEDWKASLRGFGDNTPVSREEESKAPPETRVVPAEVCAFPAAADVRIQVARVPGRLPQGDLKGRLLRVMPPEWEMEDPAPLDDPNGPFGYKPRHSYRFDLAHFPAARYMSNCTGLRVWVLADAAERDPKAKVRAAEYLGKGKLGHVYADMSSPEFGGPLPRWLHAKHDIAAVLGVETPPSKPDGPDWGRLICRILGECQRRPWCGWSLLHHGQIQRRGADLVRLKYYWSEWGGISVPPSSEDFKVRPDDVLFAVRSAESAPRDAAWDRVIDWRTPAGTRGQIVWRVRSDDRIFAEQIQAIFERVTMAFLRKQQRDGVLLFGVP